jgi:uncharacterized protein (DUF849 family)
MNNKPVIVTCALTGGAKYNPEQPYVPVTPEEIANSAIASAKAGAAVAHIHVRDPETTAASQDVDLYREVVERIREADTDIVINVTAGGYARFLPDPADESKALPGSTVAPVDVRVKHIEETLPDICSLDVTTANQGDGATEFVYLNTTRTLRAMAKRFQSAGVKPELEVFQAGDILFARQLIDEGLVDAPAMFQFVLGIQWGAPADPETVMYMRNLLPEGANWTAFGISRSQMPMVATSVLMGGNVRVGLEDNLYLKRGVFARNEELVAQAVNIVESLGRRVATPDEAREILGIGSGA